MFKKLPINRSAECTMDLYFGEEFVASFTGRYLDLSSPSLKLAMARRNRGLSAKDLQRIRTPKCEADIEYAASLSVDFFLDQEAITGWEIEGEGGKPVPFTRGNLRSFLLHPDYRWAFGQVEAFFTDESNFAEKTKAEVVGESSSASTGS